MQTILAAQLDQLQPRSKRADMQTSRDIVS